MFATSLILAFVASSSAMMLPSQPFSAPLMPTDGEIIEGEYIVMYDEITSFSTYDVLETAGIDAEHVLHTYDNGFAAKMSDEALKKVRKIQGVAWVEPNQVVHAYDTETQFNVPSWGLARISQRQFRTRNSYTYPSSAGSSVTAYIIDTGINVNHVDFEGRAKWGATFANDGNDDKNGHGTHVASTVGGKTFGVAKKVELVAVKVLNGRGSGTMADVIKGVEWAAKDAKRGNKKAVANMSLGGGRSPALDRAVESAIASGLSFAVAAGNSNTDACRSSPSAVETAVTVAASTVEDKRAYFSNLGKCVDIVAPGLDITGAWIGSVSAKKTISGTSMASPHVCGVMALMLAEKDYTPQQLKKTLEETATKSILSGLGQDTPNRLLFNAVSA